MAKARNYKREYKISQSKPRHIDDRSSRNKARRAAEKAGRVHKGDGKEIDHRDGNPRNNSTRNLRVTSRRANRRKG